MDSPSPRPFRFWDRLSQPSRIQNHWLDVEVSPDEQGLRLITIGSNSPLRRLAPPGDLLLVGTLEIGDQIVAINGIRSGKLSDLDVLKSDSHEHEITIFDYRTRQTVSWKLNPNDVSPMV